MFLLAYILSTVSASSHIIIRSVPWKKKCVLHMHAVTCNFSIAHCSQGWSLVLITCTTGACWDLIIYKTPLIIWWLYVLTPWSAWSFVLIAASHYSVGVMMMIWGRHNNITLKCAGVRFWMNHCWKFIISHCSVQTNVSATQKLGCQLGGRQSYWY